MLQQKLLKTILSYNLIKWETHTHTKLTHPEYKEDEKKNHPHTYGDKTIW